MTEILLKKDVKSIQREEKGNTVNILKHATPKTINAVVLKMRLDSLYTGGLFYCYMLDENICHLGVSGLFCGFYSIFATKSC